MSEQSPYRQGYLDGYRAAQRDANRSWSEADKVFVAGGWAQRLTDRETDAARLATIAQAHAAGIHDGDPAIYFGCVQCNPAPVMRKADLDAAEAAVSAGRTLVTLSTVLDALEDELGPSAVRDLESRLQHKGHYGVSPKADQGFLFGSDAHGGPMSGEGAIRPLDGCDWPGEQCKGHAPSTIKPNYGVPPDCYCGAESECSACHTIKPNDDVPAGVFRTSDRAHELHVQDHDLKPWCEQCTKAVGPCADGRCSDPAAHAEGAHDV